MSGPNYPVAISQVLNLTAQQRIADLALQLANLAQWQVLSGPFAGMVLSEAASWGDGDLAPKLLGCYEAELHSSIEQLVARQPDLVINVGCAEGYYAIGLARLLPQARIYAFDIDEAAQQCCAQAAVRNGVDDRVTVGGFCDPARLIELAASAERVFILLDCEGGERQLLTPASAPHLAHCDILVECHDFLDRSITPNLTALLASDHDIAQIREGARDPAQHSVLGTLGSLERWLLVCEFRPEVMHWLICKSKSRSHAEAGSAAISSEAS
jgi:hypothetical protein